MRFSLTGLTLPQEPDVPLKLRGAGGDPHLIKGHVVETTAVFFSPVKARLQFCFITTTKKIFEPRLSQASLNSHVV